VMSKSFGLNYDSRSTVTAKATGAHTQREAPARQDDVYLGWCNRMTRNSFGVKTEFLDVFVMRSTSSRPEVPPAS
jgi:hypothetical protein